jgi:hypothetical protein
MQVIRPQLGDFKRSSYGCLMQRNPIKLRLRRTAFWTVLAIAYCAIAVAIMVWYSSPSSQDLAFERQLIGQWGMWLAESDMNEPPQRVMEWLPGGKSEGYTPGFKRKLPQPDVWENWRIRNGILIWRIRTAETRKTVETRHKLEWVNSDSLRLTFDGLDGNPAMIYYKRLNAKSDVSPNTDEQGGATEFSAMLRLLNN